MKDFPSIRIEGGILAPDILDQLLDGELPGQRPSDFALQTRRSLSDEIAATFTDARELWHVFQRRLERLPEADSGTSLTRDTWAIPFLGLLGYELRYNSRAYELDGLTFAISHRAGEADDAPPVHIVSARQELGRLPPAGRPRLAPHSLVQEFLNRSEHLWGIVTNGLTLRLLRDSTYLRRQAYVEFDLRGILEGQQFESFAVLYRLLHRTRLPVTASQAHQCLLEQYYQHSVEQGGRVREHLRDSVKECIRLLADGFLSHPKNSDLRRSISPGYTGTDRMDPQELYRQLLRLVYRLLFLLVSEDRGLISSNSLYREHYGVARLRRLVDRRTAYNDYEDLWHSLRVLWKVLCHEEYAQLLEVAPLNGEMFEPLPLDAFAISNRHLLEAFWYLAYYQESPSSPPRRVNYAALDVEELGSVYESLLDYRPQIDTSGAVPRFELAPGSERKSTGSYYTPPELVAELIRSALDPVIEERLKPARTLQEKERAILSIRVLDPACGSGHFLLAAARRLGKELARIRTGEEEPAPERVREAIRDVVGHCIYGVDKNPLAVELARVALWLESHSEGKPLTFLDHRIRCGDSLVGVFDLQVLKDGIPDEAFEPLSSDDRERARIARRRNAEEREGQLDYFGADADFDLTPLVTAARRIDTIPDDSPQQVRRKRDAYEAHLTDPLMARLKDACDLWTAAFYQQFLSSNSGGGAWEKGLITTSALRRLLAGQAIQPQILASAKALATENRFFHWPLEFPEAFESGGFDVVLSNPPWERIKLQEEEFFAGRDAEIARAPNAAARKRLIVQLPGKNPDLWQAYQRALHNAESTSRFLRGSAQYPLTGRGDINTYSVFAERARRLLRPQGRAGIIVPTGIATDATNQFFFADLVTKGQMISLFDFENREKLFPAVDSRMKFCLLTLGGRPHPLAPSPKALREGEKGGESIRGEGEAGAQGARTQGEKGGESTMGEGKKGDEGPTDTGPGAMVFVFFATRPEHLRDPRRTFTLSTADIARINPNTRTLPVFRTRQDAELTRAIYQRAPVLVNEGTGENPWGVRFLSMFHMANDSHLFRTCRELEDQGYRLVGNVFVASPPSPLSRAAGEGEGGPSSTSPFSSATGEGEDGHPSPSFSSRAEGEGEDGHPSPSPFSRSEGEGRSGPSSPSAFSSATGEGEDGHPSPSFSSRAEGEREGGPSSTSPSSCAAGEREGGHPYPNPSSGTAGEGEDGHPSPSFSSAAKGEGEDGHPSPSPFSRSEGEGRSGPSSPSAFSSATGEGEDGHPSPSFSSRAEGEREGGPSSTSPSSGAKGEREDGHPSSSPFSRSEGEGRSGPSSPSAFSSAAGEGEDGHPSPSFSSRAEGEGEYGLPGASRELVARARQLRRDATAAELLLWEFLRDRRLLGRKFRRQHPIGQFIADFFCDDARLIIEIDGAVHLEASQQERDRLRDEILRQYGLTVLRFTNDQILHRTGEVIREISAFVASHSYEHPAPLPQSPRKEAGSNSTPLSQSLARGAGGEGPLSQSLGREAGGEDPLSQSLGREAGGENPLSQSLGREAGSSSTPLSQSLGRGAGGEGYLPLYEAKMIWHYDHRYGTYQGVSDRSSTQLPTPDEQQHADPNFVVLPWYWVPAQEVLARLGNWRRGWLLGFRDVTNATNERTAVFSLLPRVGVGHTLPILLVGDISALHISSLLANLNVLTFDWALRQKIGGMHLTFFMLRQLPVLPPSAYSPEDLRFIVPRVLELVYTAWDMKPFADDVWREADEQLRAVIGPHPPAPSPKALGEGERGGEGIRRQGERGAEGARGEGIRAEGFPLPPYRWDEDRRARLRAELDAYYARLYGLTRKQLRYILDPADLTEGELKDILDPWEEVSNPLDPDGYAARVAASTFPGETFRVLKEKEMRRFGEYRTRRLVLEAWENLSSAGAKEHSKNRFSPGGRL